MTPADVPALKRLIEATGLFPSAMLREMLGLYFAQTAAHEAIWLTDDAEGSVGVAYCASERMTEGTWNLNLIAVHPDRQGRGHGTRLLRSVEQSLIARRSVLRVNSAADPRI